MFGRKLLHSAAALTATLILSMLGSAPGNAASPSERECAGTFTREQGEVQCVVVEEGKNPKFTEETETTGQGNVDNKTASSSECSGTGSNKCPPGQF
jgi:hypothetical protein